MVKVIAEIGCNHKGDMDIARELIRAAVVDCGAHVAKFQKRCNKELLTEEEYQRPHPNSINAYGPTYGLHREFLELDLDQHKDLKSYCESLGSMYSTSVWDLTSAKEISRLNPELIKIPSATNLNFELQGWLCENYSGQIHLSVGMTTPAEIRKILEFYNVRGRSKDVVLYACTSGYPVDNEDICLLEISRLQDEFGHLVGAVGFSGHHLGVAPDVAAMALGATWIERHFTLNRHWKGTDHSASLDVSGMKQLCDDLDAVSKAMTYKRKDILPVEQVQRDKLKSAGVLVHG